MGFISKLFGNDKRSAYTNAVFLANGDAWALGNFSQQGSSFGLEVNPDAAMRLTAVFAAVRKIAKSVAMLPLNVYKVTPTGKTIAYDHPLYNVLHTAPNKEQTSFAFREMMQGHTLLRGNSYAQILRLGTKVTGLYPLHPDRVRILQQRASNGNLVYRYTAPDGTQTDFDQSKIFHFKGFGTDGVYGLSPIRLAMQTLELAMGAEAFGAYLFKNAARPDIVFNHPGKMSKAAQDRMVESFEERHKGLVNAHRPAVLEEGMTIDKLGFSAEESQFLQTREFQIGDIARIFELPPHLIGDLSDATFSNIEQQAAEFVMSCLQAWITRWEQELTMKLLSEQEQLNYKIGFVMQALMRADTAARGLFYAQGRNWGWFSINDIRELEDMSLISDEEGGNTYLEPLNMVPAGTDRSTLNQQPAQPGDKLEPDDPANEPVAPPKDKVPPAKKKEKKSLDVESVRTAYSLIFEDLFGRIYRKEALWLEKSSRSAPGEHDIATFFDGQVGYTESTLGPAFRSLGTLSGLDEPSVEHLLKTFALRRALDAEQEARDAFVSKAFADTAKAWRLDCPQSEARKVVELLIEDQSDD